MEYNDYELVSFAQEKNETAYNTLYMKYKPLLDKKANRFYQVVSNKGIEQEDIKQEVLVAFEQAINDYKEEEDTLFYTFVNLCVDRELQNLMKKLNRYKNKIFDEAVPLEGVNDDENSLLNIIVSDTHNPEIDLLNLESTVELQKIIKENLSEFEIDVLRLRIQGFSYKEIAEKLDKNVKSVDCAIQRAKGKLGKFINNR